MTDAGRGSVGNESLLSPDEVTAALANPLPSELLLKGKYVLATRMGFTRRT
jgi:hypothetical protein